MLASGLKLIAIGNEIGGIVIVSRIRNLPQRLQRLNRRLLFVSSYISWFISGVLSV
jgi:hypothetical protein